MNQNCFPHNLLIRFRENQHKTAFSLYDGTAITDVSYGKFCDDVLSVAGYFKSNGIRNKHIAFVSPGGYRWIVAFLGAMVSGNVIVSLNPALPAELLKWQLEFSDSELVYTDDSYVGKLSEQEFDLPIIVFSQVIAGMPIAIDEIVPIHENDAAVMVFTSGTTGASKAAQLTLLNLWTGIQNAKEIFDGFNSDRSLGVMPLFHIAAIQGALQSFYYGNTICIGRGIGYIMMDIPIFQPISVMLVPLMVENLIKLMKRCPTQEDREKYIGKKLKRITVVGAALQQEYLRYLLNMGFIVNNVYGMTETAGSGTRLEVDLEHNGSIGKPLGDVQCQILDGELLLKSGAIMKGYYKDTEETAKVIRDGWIYTGDLARCDADGYYYITGRKKNVIILPNGENVNPGEVEEKLGRCPEIEECLVYSDGKGICADVFAVDEASSAAYIKHYNEEMPPSHQIYKVYFTKEPLPKTATGKIKRKENV